jgi:hypothetical protein
MLLKVETVAEPLATVGGLLEGGTWGTCHVREGHDDEYRGHRFVVSIASICGFCVSIIRVWSDSFSY